MIKVFRSHSAQHYKMKSSYRLVFNPWKDTVTHFSPHLGTGLKLVEQESVQGKTNLFSCFKLILAAFHGCFLVKKQQVLVVTYAVPVMSNLALKL